MTELRTARLRLRAWQPQDREPFAALNADAEVMRHFPAPLDRAASDAAADRIADHLDRRGWGLWALSPIDDDRFLGFVGLSPVPEPIRDRVSGRPRVEVGWRLARAAWGRGFATESARAALRHGFDVLDLREIVSFTSTGNRRSRAVMERLGMMHDPVDDFDHPRVPKGPLRRHVLYRARR